VDVDPLVNAMILQGADHLQSGAIAHVRQARIPMSAEIFVAKCGHLRAVKHRAPGLEFTHPRRGFLGVQLSHTPIIMYWPPRIVSKNELSNCHDHLHWRAPRQSHPQPSLYGLAQKRFANQADGYPPSGSFNGSPQTGASGPITKNVVLDDGIISHMQKSPKEK
jgi:hypothetical protein